jgi:Carboxypeptidase regulatory-like domain
MRFLATCFLLIVLAATAFSQTTSRLEGSVTDPQGAAVVGAQVKVINTATGQTFDLKSDERGFWALPSMETGVYRVMVSLQGFKTEAIENIKIDAGAPTTANATLQVGSLTETVEVTGGAEILQTATATVQSTMVGRQLHELPFTSRNITELIVTQPGSVTPGVPRSTSVYGLPQSALNTTLDGINIQDNSNRSSDGFFLGIFPRADAIEEMTVVGAAAGADSNGEGAVQMKLVTKSGSNEWHGGLFEQTRNQMFDSNYYFNTIQRLPRDHVVFNQFGGLIGGPIKKNKAFFFVHMEALQLPQTYSEPTGTVLTPTAASGIFTYKDSSGNVVTKNLLAIAAANGLTSTTDPIISKTLGQIQSLVAGQPGLVSRIATNTDYNRNNLDFQSTGGNYRRFPTVRLDYNLTQKEHLEFIYNYQTNLRSPDGVNIGTASPIFPGTGNVINGTVPGNQGGISFSGVLALRSTLTPRLTNEIRGGLTGGTVIFNNGIGQPDFAQFGGYAPTFSYVTSPYRTTGQTRRNTPVKQINDNLSYTWRTHLINAGFAFTQVNTWTTSANGTQFIPGVTFGLAAGDPAVNVFSATNLPGSNATNQSDAGALYALLTGRVASIARSVVLDDATKKYGAFQPIVKNRQRETGIFVQDAWRVRNGLTFNYGMRVDMQFAPINLNGVYTRPEFAGLYGISGVGNLFSPGTLTGSVPQYNLTAPGETGYSMKPLYAPSAGLAWVVPKTGFKPLAMLLGREGSTVLRAGYSINSVREDGSTFSVWGTNQGRTVTTSVDPANFASIFGAPGSVLFRNPLPARVAPTDPTFPLAVAAGNSLADYSPDLRTGYVQSWNFGWQRELTKDTVLEVRYVGNHGTDLWRNVNLNEVNIFENGFLNEFKIAQANLALARQSSSASNVYAGLAGQQALPIISTAIGANNDTTTATQIAQGQAGALASAIAINATRMARLAAIGKPANFFQVNPLQGGSSTVVVNAGSTHYNGLQVEIRRRMSKGLLFQGSYVWSHSTGNEFSNGVGGTFTTLRNYGLDNGPSPYDIRQALKMNWIYELPIGPNQHFLSGFQNAFVKKSLQGWELASVARIQSGSPIRLISGRSTFDGSDSGVVLHNITASQLQDMMSIRKTTNAQGNGTIFFLPQSLIDNSQAAFDLAPGKTVDTTQPYIGPPVAGQLGDRVFLYGPMQQKWDVSLVKKTYITEKVNFELRAQALNVFNLTNFLLFVPGSGITTTLTANSTSFGQTTGAFRDLSNTNDTGGRMIEFVMRLNF